MQNKRSRNEMKNPDVLNLLPGFEKVWSRVSSRHFDGIQPIRNAEGNYMYF